MQARCAKCKEFKPMKQVTVMGCPACLFRTARCSTCGGAGGAMRSVKAHFDYWRVRRQEDGGHFQRLKKWVSNVVNNLQMH